MIVIQTKRFLKDFSELSENKKNFVANLVNILITSENFEEHSFKNILGFPYIFKIDFNDKCIVFCYSNITNTIELSGIVPEGSELTLFF